MLQGGHERLTDRQTGWIQYTPPNFVAGGYNNINWADYQNTKFDALNFHKIVHSDNLQNFTLEGQTV